MIPSWLAIASVTFLAAVVSNRLQTAEDMRWFFRLRRPSWLTFERAIPLIWIGIFICGAWSAVLVWEANPGSPRPWGLMGLYLVVELAILSYTPVMCKLRSLRVGTAIGGMGFLLGWVLALQVQPISTWGFVLLLPYLLWSPVGTFVTWQMMQLNPLDA